MRTSCLSFLRLITAVSLAGSVNAATISNGDFLSATSTNTTGGNVVLSTLTAGVWSFNQSGTKLNWAITGGVAKYDATPTGRPDARTRVLAQVIDDNSATTGTVNLNFDIQITSLEVNANSDMGLYVFGWNDGQAAPNVDMGESVGKALTDVVDSVGDAVSLIGGTYTIFENGVIAPSGVDQIAGFDSVSVPVNFGSGYDNVAVLFVVSFTATDTNSIVELDKVAFASESPLLITNIELTGGNVVLTTNQAAASLTPEISQDLTAGSFIDVVDFSVTGANEITIDSTALTAPSYFFRVRE